MSELWDKLKTELDKAGKAAQDVLDEGKVRIELFRLRQAADKNAEALGYAVYRARKEGREPDADATAQLIKSLAEQEAEMSRLQAELKRAGGESASSDTPATSTTSDTSAG
jgi:hypothetical protein